MLIGVLADTHIPSRAKQLPEAVRRGLTGVNLILHAGDIFDLAVLRELEKIAPVTAVAGNGDPPELAEVLGRQKLFVLDGCSIGLIHGDGVKGTTRRRAQNAFPAADCIVFGHSHMPCNERENGLLLFNPGSPTDRRRSPRPSYGLLSVADGIVSGAIIYF